MRANDSYAPGQDGLPKLKPLYRRKHLTHLKPLYSNLAALGGGIKFELNLPDTLLGGIDGVVHLDDPDVKDLLSRLDTKTTDDEQMAKRVVNLKRTQYPNSPYTELIMVDWFTRNGVQFAYQVPFGGGRQTKMGQVLDFAVFTGGSAIAVPCQGQYWHSKPDVAASDELDKIQALGQLVNGFRIDRYVPVWERWLYKDRQLVLSFAIAGSELGQ